MKDLLAKEIERIAEKYKRPTLVCADTIVGMDMVNEEGFNLALSEFGEFVIKQAAEVARSRGGETSMDDYVRGYAAACNAIEEAILSMSVR